MKTTKRMLFIAFLALAAVAAASVAYAAIPSANGTITGCVDSKGSVKLIDVEAGANCGTGKTALSWNQQGPAGQPGPAGPQGVPGPSDLYTEDINQQIVLPAGNVSTTLAALDLPAGLYLLFAKATVFNTVPSTTACLVKRSSGEVFDALSVRTNWPTDPYATVVLSRAISVTQDSSVTLSCSGPAGTTLSRVQIHAIKVGSFHS